MLTNQILHRVVMLILSMAISACGFQLRGSQIDGEQSIQGQRVSLTNLSRPSYAGFENTGFDKIVKRQLVAAGAQVVDAGSQDNELSQPTDIVIKLLSLNFSQQGVSRDETGRANEHEVTARLEFQLSVNNSPQIDNTDQLKARQDELMEVQSLSATANYFQDYRNPIGGQAQQRETRQLLLQQLSQSLLYQIQYIQKYNQRPNQNSL